MSKDAEKNEKKFVCMTLKQKLVPNHPNIILTVDTELGGLCSYLIESMTI